MRSWVWLSLCSSIFVLISLMLYRALPSDQSHIEIDSGVYERVAMNFAHTGSLMDDEFVPSVSLGYPLFLGIIYRLFGHHLWLVVLLQVLLALGCMLLIYRIAQSLFNEEIARIAALLTSFNLGFIVYTQLIMTEVLLSFLLLLFFERYISYLRTKHLGMLIQAGLILGISIMVKPAALWYALIISGVLWWHSSGTWIHKLKYVGLFLLCFLIPCSVYMARNKRAYGTFSLAPLARVNVYNYFLPKVIARIEGRSEWEVKKEIADLFAGKDVFDFEGYAPAHRLFMKTMRTHPFAALLVWGENVMKTGLGLYTIQLKVLFNRSLIGGFSSIRYMTGSFLSRVHQYITHGTDSVAIMVIGYTELFYMFIRYLLIMVALLWLFMHRRWLHVVLLGSYVGYFALITGHDGCGRFRMMFEGILVILTAVGLYLVYMWLQGNRIQLREILKD